MSSESEDAETWGVRGGGGRWTIVDCAAEPLADFEVNNIGCPNFENKNHTSDDSIVIDNCFETAS